jgi:5-methylcytosine-specific restriction endonuclease McrA
VANFIDLTGQRFGRLIAERRANNGAKGSLWACRCDCGGEITCRIDSLTTGNTQSCGCLRREAIARSNRLSIVGARFGKLTALEPIGVTVSGSVKWKCRCDCGGERIATVARLRAGLVISCGCAARDPIIYSPERVRAKASEYGHRRRARMLGAGGSFTAAEIKDLHAKQRGRCACCRGKLPKSYHKDHIVALVNGGTNYIWNIQLLCDDCHRTKGTMDPIEWAQKRGRLL